MMLNYLVESFKYVVSDPFFPASMAVTVMIGVFIGAVVYDGCIEEIKKFIISLLAYAFIVLSVNMERILPSIYDGIFKVHRPFSSIITIVFVTVFYLLGMYLGVIVTKHAHNGKHSHSR